MYGTNGSSDGTVFLDDPATWASGSMPDSKKLEKTESIQEESGIYAQDFISLTKV
jgi:iron complex outermembrane receptor protein